ncbi:alanine:cation symporter family protein [Clostridium botulinum]|uniref:Amino acid carrier protein AlsT n=1 Tax=Clostridium botulinum (strain Eklund 17B / Type B) TaxID=935198 RepID=B2TML1_CLOBB|nr:MULTISPECIES: alanine/glycine:cation symporter family protein [Clostridium]ACD24476.1 amino acid carrier protein AlsT [Clostridium botulinum B str. Eklund 17B (NRP)]MBY6975170.1 alanine:cation symporter family protein [Clostridium botulinum]MCR1274925.1 alanine:cation symporter family protein [Clostridium botulinum]NFD68724.1 alanine:cation symporter family protein [Clostridium botulinum]NFF31567.1 alanine:cation symporter family protein [Clostridium botulinum]
MDILNNLLVAFNDFLYTYILIALLIVLGLYFSYKTKFVQFRFIKEMFRLLGDGVTSERKKGSVSSFQAFCISTASRVGTGNLAGIAIAISIGGPGAIFWMWIIALIGAGSSFVESTLAQIYKTKDKNGAFRGGPAYYIEKGLNKKWMGVLFSILITVSFGLVFNSVQSNTISLAMNEAFGVNQITIGIILTALTLVIIFGGVHRVAKVSEIIVPIMAVAYILVSLFVVFKNFTHIPRVFTLILENAFGLQPAIGGTLGGTLMIGIKRGLFSNEAGMGSAPNAAATADVTHPVKQGLIQTLGVFTDTIIICSCTAFIILLADIDLSGGLTGIQLTQNALSSQIGNFGTIFVAICILLFAFSSIVGNYYYGESNIEFLSKKKIYLIVYRIAVASMVFFGSIANLDIVWNLADTFMGFMAIINLIAITLLGRFAFKALDDYRAQKKAGIKEPVFKASSIPELTNVDEWK